MYHYDLTQWLLFFFVYAFFGWIWESCYVSVRNKRWVNRGFLNGPFLPIYGFGAIAILWATLPVRNSIALIYLFGMLSATILEYVTGAAMERLFRVRYWDYSKHKFNLNGHICLGVSLGWGLFAVFLVKGIHLPIESLILQIPPLLGDILATILVVVMAVDVTASFNEAMDLKETLIRLSESREQIARLQRRLEIISTVAIDDINRKKQERSENDSARSRCFWSGSASSGSCARNSWRNCRRNWKSCRPAGKSVKRHARSISVRLPRNCSGWEQEPTRYMATPRGICAEIRVLWQRNTRMPFGKFGSC